MNILDKVRSYFGSAFSAANPSSQRSLIPYIPMEVRNEFDAWTRFETMRKARYIQNNTGLGKRIIASISDKTVGKGIIPRATTTDTAWNDRATEYFDSWATSKGLCDVAAKMDHYRQQKVFLASTLVDGQCLSIRTYTANGLPTTQMVQANQIAGGRKNQDGWVDGIRVNGVNRAIEYRFVGADNKEKFVSANNVSHGMIVDRPNQIHGITRFSHAINSMTDREDLYALEKAAAKLNAALALVLSGKSGDVKTVPFTGPQVKTKTASPVNSEKEITLENIMRGGIIQRLPDGVDVKHLPTERPNLKIIEFLNDIVRDVAAGFNVSSEFVWAMAGLTGANTRFALEDAAWLFSDLQEYLIADFCTPTWRHVISNAIEIGDLPFPKDPDIRFLNKVAWTTPRKVTVDMGRDGQLNIDLVKSAMMTRRRYYEGLGLDSKRETQEWLDETAEILNGAKARGIPPGIALQMPPGTAGVDQQQPADTTANSETP